MNDKNLANIITVSRIIVSISIAFVIPFSSTFFLLYSYCGISDIIDGFVARKTHTESVRGALLDSIADIVFLVSYEEIASHFLASDSLFLLLHLN